MPNLPERLPIFWSLPLVNHSPDFLPAWDALLTFSECEVLASLGFSSLSRGVFRQTFPPPFPPIRLALEARMLVTEHAIFHPFSLWLHMHTIKKNTHLGN